MSGLRRVVPYALLPLSLVGCVLASAPWLRAFPSSVLAVPLFGSALLSVLIPLIVVGIGFRRLWVTALIDVVLAVFYELLVTLRDVTAVDRLWAGLVHGPSQILTFALPLVSPRELMVVPVALCWVTGSVIGECVARGWHSPLPYLAMIVGFGVSYAGTARAVTSGSDGRRYDTVLAAALLLTLLLLRAAQAWVAQDESADTTQPDGVLPLRGLVVGAALSIVVTVAASGIVQLPGLARQPATPARTPPVAEGRPLTPVSFVSQLRPENPKTPGRTVFRLTTDRPGPRYVTLADIDFYDGDGWSFDRTFRPSGGVIPADADPSMRPPGRVVTQTYTIAPGPLTSVPWMPYENRAEGVAGVGVDIDSDSGMIVPARSLRAGAQYTVRSRVPTVTFDRLGPGARIGTSALANDLGLAGDLEAPLATLVQSLVQETGTSASNTVEFLQAVAREFRTKSSLAGGVARTASRSASPGPSPSASATAPAGHTGGTAFADVLASIRSAHAATPEQYATLMALVARKLLVPVRVVSGFRLPVTGGGALVPAGNYDVTTALAWTWVEIPVRGQGWVVLDPSPDTYAGTRSSPPAGGSPSTTPSSSPAPTAQLRNGNEGNAAAPPSRIGHQSSISTTSAVLLIGLAVLVAALLVATALLLRKAARLRRRRRSRDPRRRLLAAWQESLDFLAEVGLPELGALTSAEVAAATEARFGDEPAERIRYLGEAANRAIFSPRSWIGGAEADAAWLAEAALARDIRRRLRWRPRMASRFRYHRAPRTGPSSGPASWAEAARSRAARHARR